MRNFVGLDPGTFVATLSTASSTDEAPIDDELPAADRLAGYQGQYLDINSIFS